MSCFVIAECGVNWRDLVDADQMIKAAAEAGADAVKFQAYDTKFSPYLKNGFAFHKRAKELNAIRLDESTVRYLYWRCQQHDIEFMCTPMYPEAVAMLDPYVKRWKVRYADRCSSIVHLCEETGKEILVSCDGILPMEGCKRLFCVSEYPPSEIPKGARFVGQNEKPMDGYSCHIPWVQDMVNVGRHVEYLEVHVRLDHYEPQHYCPIDTAVSITMSELAELCRRLKQ